MPKLNLKSTYEGRNICLFETLGDGCLLKEGRLQVAHAEHQKDYLLWKKDLLEQNGIQTLKLYEYDYTTFGSTRHYYRFRTRSYEFIKKYRQIMYTPTKNITLKSILRRLTPLGLAIWYMDDGTLHCEWSDTANRYVNLDIKICTALPKKQNQIIIDYFKEKWNIEFHQLHIPGTQNDGFVRRKDLWQLRARRASSLKFLELVYPIVSTIPCMAYKVRCM